MADEIVVEPGPDTIAVFDVPLVGDEPAPVPPNAPRPDRPNRRRSAAVVIVGSLIAGLVGAAILFDDGTDADDQGRSTVPADELSSQITTPPTLGPLDTIPAPDDPALRPATGEGPQPTTSQDRDLFASVTVPSYPPVADVALSELVLFDIADAVDRLAEDRPRRSETHLELGTGGFVLDVTIEREPERDRYRLVLESGGRQQTVFVDGPANRTVVIGGEPGQVLELTNDELLHDTDATSINELFDPLLLGPLRPETYDPVATRGRSLVTVDGDRIVRQFVTVISGSLIPEWQLYSFSPTFEFPVEDRPSELEYLVYVDEAGDIVQVDGLSMVGTVPQLVTHRLVGPVEPIVIDIPELVDDLPPTGSSPATTSPGG